MRALVAAACVLSVACSSSGGTPAASGGSCPLAVQWGAGSEASFVAFADGDPVTCAVDSAGGLGVLSTLRLTGTAAATATLEVTVTPDESQPDPLPPMQADLTSGPDGSRYATGLDVRIRGIAPDVAPGRRVLVMVVAHAEGCTSWTAATVRLQSAP